jgi:hypothetical protein
MGFTTMRNPRGSVALRLAATVLAATAAEPGSYQLQAVVLEDDGIQAAEGGAKQPTFKVNGYNGGPMRPASPWLPHPLVVDLAGAQAVDGAVALLDHDPCQIVGQASKVTITDSGIVFEGVITGNMSDKDDPAYKVVSHAKNKFKWKASIDASIGRLEFIPAGEAVKVNGRQFTGPIYIARSTTIDGVSFVTIAADKTTSAAIAAQAQRTATMEFHAWLIAKGFDPATISDKQRDNLLKMFNADPAVIAARAGGTGGGTGGEGGGGNGGGTTPPAPGNNGQPNGGGTIQAHGNGSPDSELVFATARAKKARKDAITAECARLVEAHPDKLDIIEATARTAHAEDWTAERFQLWAYRELPSNLINTRPRSGRGGQVDARVIEAGVARMVGLADMDKHYDARTIEASEQQFRHGVGLVELLQLSARAHGHMDVSSRDPYALLRAAFPADLRASGPSTFDVSGILSNVANKAIVQHFMAVDQTWAMIAATRPVSDFKQITSYSLTGDMQYVEVAPGGELKHATAGEQSYTNQAKTYGRMFGIDRRDIINDDLGAFNSVTKRIGRGGALKLNDVFWTTFLDNSTFFTTARNNLDEGNDTEFDIDALVLAEKLFVEQTDPDGKPLGAIPKLLLVPPQYHRPALQVMNSSGVLGTSGGDANTFKGNFKVGSSPYMSNASYTGYSAKKWYLLADPNDIPVIEVAFLNGVQRPTVESAQADFQQLGVQFRGYFDFGAALQEYRGGVAMKGEA